MFAYISVFIKVCYAIKQEREFYNNKTDKINMITEEMYEIDIPILIQKDSAAYESSPFARR